MKTTMWHNTDRIWNVNGCLFLADGNFLNHFVPKRIGATPIYIGSYPNNEGDFSTLAR